MNERNDPATGPVRTVLHVAQSGETGLAYAVESQVRHQVARGWRVVVAAPPGELSDVTAAAGARVLRWDAERSPGPSVAGEARRLRRIVDQVDPDLVHLHSAKAGLVGRLVLRGRRPTVFTPHAWSWLAASGNTERLARTWERAGARWAHVIIALSPAEADDAAAAGVRGRIEIVPNDVPVARLRAEAPAEPATARAQRGIPADAPVVVCTARLAPQKGQDVLLQAWPNVTAAIPEARLYLVGDGEDRAKLEEAARGLLGVHFVGMADRTEAVSWMKAASLVVCPSRYEGMSLVPLEAAALGVPVVATDVEGMRTDLSPAARRIVPTEDPAALATALSEALADPAGLAAGGAEATRWADSMLAQRSASTTMDLYQELIAD